jgi:hypothetical protein
LCKDDLAEVIVECFAFPGLRYSAMTARTLTGPTRTMRSAKDARNQYLPRTSTAPQRRAVLSGSRRECDDIDPEKRHKHAKSDDGIGHEALRDSRRPSYFARCYGGIRKSLAKRLATN